MTDNRLNLLSSELYTASSYIDRVFHAIINVPGLKVLPSNQKICATFNEDLHELLKNNIFHPRLTGPKVSNKEWPTRISPEKMKFEVHSISGIFTTLIILDQDTDQIIETTVEFINLLYTFANLLHSNCKSQANIDVTLPRVGLTTIDQASEEYRDNKFSAPKYVLEINKFNEIGETRGVSISSLELRRNQKYEELLQKGHQAIFEQRPEKALAIFERASNFKESAEILTLIGWANSLIGNMEKAKSFCLKAIKTDADYGPPYNDLGSYVLPEGNYEEALKWFSLAKKSKNYTNREYPYINSGRVYVTQKKFDKALIEFEDALIIAPFQEELENTIKDLKEKIAKIKDRSDDIFTPQL